MKHKDISNLESYSFGVRVDGFLLKFKEDGLRNNVLNFFLGKGNRAEINEDALFFLNRVYRKTPFSAYLILESRYDSEKMQEFLIDNFPFNELILVKNEIHISTRLNVGEISYYVDDDANRRSLVNSTFALSLSQANSMLRELNKLV